MNFEFTGIVIYWRGPAPYYFVAIPEEQSLDIKAISGLVTYGWGVIPVTVRIGNTEWKTSLFPRDGRYMVPLKASARKAENIDLGDEVKLWLQIAFLG